VIAANLIIIGVVVCICLKYNKRTEKAIQDNYDLENGTDIKGLERPAWKDPTKPVDETKEKVKKDKKRRRKPQPGSIIENVEANV